MADGSTHSPIIPNRQRLHAEKYGAEIALREALAERAALTDGDFDLELDGLADIANEVAEFVRRLEPKVAALRESRAVFVRGFGTVMHRQHYDALGIAEAVASAFSDELTAAADNYLVAAVRAEVG